MTDNDTIDYRTRELAKAAPRDTFKPNLVAIGPDGQTKRLPITPVEYARLVEMLTTEAPITYRVQPHDITTLTWPMWEACGIECPKMIGAACPADDAHFRKTCPGWSAKWDNAAAEVVYDWSLHWQPETCGDVDQPIGYNAIFRADPGEQDGPMGVGLILTTGSRGDVALARYTTALELDMEWGALQKMEAEYFRANCEDCAEGEPCADHEGEE